jgi:hypothetical protein
MDVKIVGAAVAAALIAGSAAHATTKVFEYDLAGAPVATGTFSYATGDTGVLDYSDLTAFSVTLFGATYTLADVTPLTDYVHFAYDTSANVFDVDPNSCGFSGCNYSSSLSALNSNGTYGFFFNGAPGEFEDYAQGTIGTFDTITIGTAGVPEPAAWALMLIGVGGLGAILRGSRHLQRMSA